jgi:PTS system ascorbate-specific IIA component
MNVGILLVTHEDLGAQLITVARTIFKQPPVPVSLVSVPSDLEPAVLGKFADLIRNAIDEQEQGQGVLVLTDIFGATPDNLARHFAGDRNARVVSGINLPMLLHVLNYAHRPLEQLCETALEGGRCGIQRDQE